MEAITFRVDGKPQPAGSKQSFVPLHKKTKQPFRRKNGGIVVSTVDANKKSKGWKQLVAKAASEAYQGPLLTGAIRLEVQFWIERPKCHYGTGRNASVLKASAPAFHLQAPDSTKYVRGLEDALKGIVWVDDCQVVRQSVAKDWGARPGADVRIVTLADFEDTQTKGGAT